MKRPRKVPAGQTTTGLPLAAGGRLLKRNQGNLWFLILAVLQVVYAAVRFREGNTRCVREWVCLDAAMVSEAGAFWYAKDLYIIFPREGQAIRYAVRIGLDHCLPDTRLV